MDMELRTHAESIAREAIRAMYPQKAVVDILLKQHFPGRIFLVAVGKAAWHMAAAALHVIGSRLADGIVITKYGHLLDPLPGILCLEAGHPIPDNNTLQATRLVLNMTANLHADDTVLFLLSGGGSALFESPLISPEELDDINEDLLACGADIVQINTIRKRLSAVKGGRFAQHCAPAQVFSVILSDVLGDPVDMIASGPTAPDSSTCRQAVSIAQQYHLDLSPDAWRHLQTETPKTLTNATNQVVGSVKALCAAAAEHCRELGYEPILLTDQLNCEAKEAGRFLASILKTHAASTKSLAFIAGGEPVVHLTGSGKGGRNQELALAAAENISGIPGAAVFSVGSDGTDGPTDAAGGYVDYKTAAALSGHGISIHEVLQNNDSYHALGTTRGLIFTGPTGTNVNDVAVALLRR